MNTHILFTYKKYYFYLLEFLHTCYLIKQKLNTDLSIRVSHILQGTCFTGTTQVQISSVKKSQHFFVKVFHDLIQCVCYDVG